MFFSNPGYSQLREIPVSKVVGLQEKNLHCLNDSANTISKFCSLDLDGFSIRFFVAYLDKNKRKVQLIGRVCRSDAANSIGIPGVEIFKATKDEGKLSGRSSIAYTTNGNKYMYNDGFFDITLTIEKDEYLFFHGTGYFLGEFALYKLLQ